MKKQPLLCKHSIVQVFVAVCGGFIPQIGLNIMNFISQMGHFLIPALLGPCVTAVHVPQSPAVQSLPADANNFVSFSVWESPGQRPFVT